ncbi:MAG TPA: ImmA/IrrE family metallo-endopeptidase [Candidatus Dormibacteraeota bacterium]|nr:ImmA/IrrE family metallo-endopeptidase [Candidatus Dormibacteraeota bacterium]
MIDLLDRRVRAIAEATLRQAGVWGVLPTPLDAVARAAGIAEIVDIGALPDDLRRARPAAMAKILGAFHFAAGAAFVDRSLGPGRSRFVQAHETAHRLLPWHERAFLLDDERRLFRETEEALEREANLLASHLIFQPGAFAARIADQPPSLRAARRLAREHGASCHATLRYYVEHHPEPLALLATGRIRRVDGTVPVWTACESPAFRRRFGPLSGRLHRRGLHLGGGPAPAPAVGRDRAAGRELAALVEATRLCGSVGRQEVGLHDRRGESQPFLAEALRQRSVLVLLSPLAPGPGRGLAVPLAS